MWITTLRHLLQIRHICSRKPILLILRSCLRWYDIILTTLYFICIIFIYYWFSNFIFRINPKIIDYYNFFLIHIFKFKSFESQTLTNILAYLLSHFCFLIPSFILARRYLDTLMLLMAVHNCLLGVDNFGQGTCLFYCYIWEILK